MASFLKFYSRRDIQKEILKIAQNREVAVKFGDKGFGKRPDILQFEGDIFEFAKEGVTSFHMSEERWHNPLDLKAGMTKAQLDNLRNGWDLVIDIDSVSFEHSQIATALILDALSFHNLDDVSLKFSGNKGFHIGIPFEAFPKKVNKVETNLLFPDGPRVIAAYLKELIKDHLTAKFLENKTIEELAAELGKSKNDFIKEGQFDPFSLSDIDTILISSRHMFRAPYSIHEKSGLVSLPIKPSQLSNFKKSDAEPDNVVVDLSFFDFENKCDASQLIIQSFDWYSKLKLPLQKTEERKKDYEAPTTAMKEEFFPPCIKVILGGIKEDGRKRALFILLNFLKSSGWSIDEIKDLVDKWNKKNYEPLKEGYILSQISWHRKQAKSILPPNCDNNSYYKDLRFCKGDDNFCKFIKNPVNYSLRKLRFTKKSLKRKKKD